MFKKYKYDIDLVAEPFENLKFRDRTVLILCRDAEGKYILGAKKEFYPKGIVRLLGGGVDDGEDVLSAAIRETREETGLIPDPEDLIELVEVDVIGKFKGKTYRTKIFVYFFNSRKDDFLAGDDVSEIIKYSEEEYRDLVKRFYDLRPDYLYNQDGLIFSWGDYGKVYGFVHKVALDELLAKMPHLSN